ncbi:MAG: DUF4215 domain-containing protein [Candidatus Woesearchaeota archaeon]|jgi:hypothetical protein
MKKNVLFNIILAIFIVFILSSFSFAVHCGDNNAQGNEECDGTDLRGYMCGIIDHFDKNNPSDYNPQANYEDEYGNLPNDYYSGSLGILSCSSNCKFVSTCHNPVCGDGKLEAAEECDNGAANSDIGSNACRTNCKLFSCGDSIADTGEQCDLGTQNNDEIPNRCRQDCTNPICGDGTIDTNLGEECDVGNSLANNGCYKCKLCYAATDNLHITRNSKLCEQTYTVSDSAEEGIIIIDGNNIKLDCNGAVIVGPEGTYAGSQTNEDTKTNLKGSQNTPSASDTAAQVNMVYVGTGIYIKGNNNVLTNCNIRQFNNAVKVEYAGNVIANNKFCSNNFGITSSSSNNFGIKNTCKESVNWRENGVAGCTYTCTNQLNSDTTCPACQCVNYELNTEETSEDNNGGIGAAISNFVKNIFTKKAQTDVLNSEVKESKDISEVDSSVSKQEDVVVKTTKPITTTSKNNTTSSSSVKTSVNSTVVKTETPTKTVVETTTATKEVAIVTKTETSTKIEPVEKTPTKVVTNTVETKTPVVIKEPVVSSIPVVTTKQVVSVPVVNTTVKTTTIITKLPAK